MKSTFRVQVGVFVAVLVVHAMLARAQGTQLLVSNVDVHQRQFAAIWDVTYDLETVGNVAVTVSLFLSADAGVTYPHLCTTTSGDVGDGILPGAGKHIVWNAGADFPGLSSSSCRLRVTADVGQIGVVPNGFVAIPPGTFMMGSPTTEPLRLANETQHQVTLTHGIYISAGEVTLVQYRNMLQWAYDRGYVTVGMDMETYPDYVVRDAMDGSTRILMVVGIGGIGGSVGFHNGTFSTGEGPSGLVPVEGVTWYGAAAYCDWTSLRQGLPRAYNHSTWECNSGNPYTAAGYRLPTEAEWEYACRAGTQTPFNTGLCLSAITEANYSPGVSPYPGCETSGNSTGRTMSETYPTNAYGLYDMHGNVTEWCNDWFGAYGGTETDPVGGGTGSNRIYRGGGNGMSATSCRSASRASASPASGNGGFRPVRSID